MNRKSITINLLILIGALIAGLTAGGCKQEEKAGGRPAAGPVEVNVMTLKTQPVELVTELPGRTVAYRVAEVRPQATGIIQKRLFTEGSEVQAGQVLYQIDPAVYQAAYDSAKAALAKAEVIEQSARQKADRYRALVQTKAVSEQDQIEVEAAWQQARAEVEVARATLQSAKIDLDYTRVTAPISGRIGRSMVTEGALVTAQQPIVLAVIKQLDPLYVDVSQSSIEMLRLKREIAAGQISASGLLRSDVTVIFDDGSTYGHAGYVEFSDVTVDESTGTVTLRAIIENPDRDLLPGMFVRARIAKGTIDNAILIPTASVIRNNKGLATVLLVNKDNQVDSRVIELGQDNGTQIQVVSGLTAGERIIVAGIQKVRPGAPVSAVEQPAGGDDQATPTTSAAAKTE